MSAAQALVNIVSTQRALSTIAVLLQLTSYRYPVTEYVDDGAGFDYIIVGAGSAGSVVANRLTEDEGVSVLLIEAGGDPPIESNLPVLANYCLKSRLDWNHTSQVDEEAYQCLQDHRLPITHGKVLGGSSSINLMAYVRGDPNDFNSWAAMANDSAWNYTNILPYFIKSESIDDPAILNSQYRKFHGTKGPLKVRKANIDEARKYIDAFNEIGYQELIDTNGDYILGVTQQTVTVADGIRQSTANAFLSNIKERPNLDVLKESLVVQIKINKKRRATGVEIIDANKRKFEVKVNKEVIISAGAINSPQLLMLSGIGPKNHLKNKGIDAISDLPVGINLQNHQIVTLMFKMGKLESTAEPLNPLDPKDPMINGFVALNKLQQHPDFQILAVTKTPDALLTMCLTVLSYKESICQYIYDETEGREVLLLLVIKSVPNHRGRVTLKSSNPFEAPFIDIDTFSNKEDLDSVVTYVEDAVRILNSTFFKSVGAELVRLPKCDAFNDSLDYWKCYIRCLSSTMFHYSGTCKMGSVVDSKLRVHGIEGLRVVDASIMPVITSGNLNAPTIMIGEKAADLIKEDNSD